MTIRLVLPYLVLCALVLAACASGTEPAYETVPGLLDVPLMPGLRADSGDPSRGEVPSGRLIEAFAKGPADRYTVVRFYHRILPRFGWTSRSQLYFVRNGETLRITLTGQDGDVRVRFLFGPH